MSLSDADLADDEANYVMTQWEEGARGPIGSLPKPNIRAAARPFVSTAAGWQWVDDADCTDDKHRARGKG